MSDPAVFVPDGRPVDEALARTTTLFVGAHPDDAELLAPGEIGRLRQSSDGWFTVVTCTDGAGSPAPDDPAPSDAGDRDLVARRSREQERAAALGGYSAAVALGRRSAEIRSPDGAARLVADLADLLARSTPTQVLTHSPLDHHPTHRAVVSATLAALRAEGAPRPRQVLGVEGWGGLDWLGRERLVGLDTSDHEELADELARCFGSQLAAKRYDLAGVGRRRANATLADPWSADDAASVTLALDLTEPARPEGPDPVAWLEVLVGARAGEAVDAWRAAQTTTGETTGGAT